MKTLNTHQTQIVSGAGEGIYYFDGVSYPFECPNVSQSCINTYLSSIQKTHPSINTSRASITTVLDVCSLEGYFAIDSCLDPIVNQIRIKAGLAPF